MIMLNSYSKFTAPRCNCCFMCIKEDFIATLKDIIKKKEYPSKETLWIFRMELVGLDYCTEGTEEQIDIRNKLSDDIIDAINYLSNNDLNTISIKTIRAHIYQIHRYYMLSNGSIMYI